MDFDRLFRQISPQQIEDDVFTPAEKVFPVITAGDAARYNAITDSRAVSERFFATSPSPGV